MRNRERRGKSRTERDSIFAGVVAAFAAAIDRFRRRRPYESEVQFTQETLLWEDEEDGGLAASRVPRRPPDRSGSGSAAAVEPNDPRDIHER
jgi:hypothetical protein